jgi:hypothetical protein
MYFTTKIPEPNSNRYFPTVYDFRAKLTNSYLNDLNTIAAQAKGVEANQVSREEWGFKVDYLPAPNELIYGVLPYIVSIALVLGGILILLIRRNSENSIAG